MASLLRLILLMLLVAHPAPATWAADAAGTKPDPATLALSPSTSTLRYEHAKTAATTLQLTAGEHAYLKAHPTIRASNELDYPPFDFAVGGQPQGYSIDLLNLLAQRIGFKVDYVNGQTWSQLVQLHREGGLDLLHSLSRTPEREKTGLFSDSYSSTKTVFVIRRNDPEIIDFAQLQGKTVVVGKGWAQEEFLRTNYPGVKRLVVDSLEQMLEAISNGTADTAFESDKTIPYWLRKKGISDLKLSGWAKEFDKGRPQGYHFYTGKTSPQLVSMLNKAMASLTPAQLQQLQAKWFEANENPTAPAQETKKITLTAEERAYMAQKGAIKMCMLTDWLPYTRINAKGETEGIGAEMIALMQERMGAIFELFPTKTESDSLRAVRERKCDLLPMTTNVSSRYDAMVFTRPSFNEPLVIATNAKELFIKNTSDIGDRQVGIASGSPLAEQLRLRYPNIRIVDVSDARDGLGRVRKGELWGYVDAMAGIGYILQKYSMLDLKIAGSLEFDVGRSIGTRNDEPLLASIMQKAEDSISDEERRAIVNKWISVRFEQGIDYAPLWKSFAAFAVLLIAGIAWNRRLAKLNKALDLAQASQRRSANTLQAIIDNAWIGIFTSSGERTVVSMNRHCDAIFRCESSAYYGKSTRSVFLSQEDFEAFGRAASAPRKANVTLEWTLAHADGSPFLAKLLGSLIDPEDRSKGAIWLVTDITEQRVSEEILARTMNELEIIFSNASIGIIFVVDRCFVRVNKTFETMCGYTAAELVGRSTRKIYASDTAFNAVGESYAALVAGQASIKIDILLCRTDGVEAMCELTGSLVDPQHPDKGSIWLCLDVTGLRRAQADLVEANQGLHEANAGLAMSADTLRLLGDVGREITANLDAAAVFAALDKHLNTLLDAFSFAIYRLSPDGETLVEVFGVEDGKELLAGEINMQDPMRDAARCARERQEIIVSQKPGATAPAPLGRSVGTLSRMYVPLMDGDRVLGVMTVQSDKENAYGERERLIFRTVCAYGAIAMANAESLAALQRAQAAVRDARDDALAKNVLIAQQHQTVAQTLEQITTLLDNSGQGFLTFGKDLRVDEGFSQECRRIFHRPALDLPLPELLCPEDARHREFLRKTLPLAMCSAGDTLRRDAYIGLLPAEYRLWQHDYEAEYKPLGDGRMMLILTNVSDAKRLKERLALERKQLEFVVNALENRDELLETVRDFETLRSRVLPDLLSFEPRPQVLLTEVFRRIHTFKSLFAQADLPTAPQALHALENRLGNLRDLGDDLDDSAIKYALGGTDLGLALEHDLGLLREKLGEGYFSTEREIHVPVSALCSLEAQAATLYGDDSRILSLVRRLRFVPLKTLIEPHFRATEQLAARQEKLLAPITCSGETALVEPDVLGPFCKALVHLFRNAVDHGIEDADTRFMADKAETARIHCEVRTVGERLILGIRDDGAGIDAGALRAKALEKGIIGPADAMGDEEAWMLVFADGLSTREEVSAISGRGVGLGVVQQELTKLGGTVLVKSVLGQGTCFEFNLPYQPVPVISARDAAHQRTRQFLAPLPGVVQDFCGRHLGLTVAPDETLREFTADALHPFTALVTLGSGLGVTLGLSVQRPLLLEMTRRFEPEFPEDEIEALADSVGAEIANTLFGKATVYFTHLQRQVELGTPQIVTPGEYPAHIGALAFGGLVWQCEAGEFIIFCLLTKGESHEQKTLPDR